MTHARKKISTNPRFWLIRFAPRRTKWADIVARGVFSLRGVKSTVARKHLRAMQLGDRVLFYQTEQNQAIMGEMEVVRVAYPDPSSADPQWVTCDFSPLRSFLIPVDLATIKSTLLLSESPIVRQPRVAVLALSDAVYHAVGQLA